MGLIGSLAVSPDGRRVYLGRRTSYERSRLNLGVLSLDAAGRRMGKLTLYPDSDVKIPLDRQSTVARILVGPKNPAGLGKLYLAVIYEGYHDLPHNLTVYDLDVNGDPTGPPRTYDSGNPQKWVTGFALHPLLERLYLVGPGGNAVYSYPLSKDGEPLGSPWRSRS
jgi:hypothetical protein